MDQTKSGLNLTVVLFIVFLILKLTGEIDWSWWWVTSPLWLPVAAVIGLFLLGVVLLSIVKIYEITIKNNS